MKEHRTQTSNSDFKDLAWRIQLIPWNKSGSSKARLFFNSDTLIYVLFSLVGLWVAIIFISIQIPFIPKGAVAIILGLSAMIGCQIVVGYFSYKNFERVEAKCIDVEVRKSDDPRPELSFIKFSRWIPRILCEYTYNGVTYKATPIISYNGIFSHRRSAEEFLRRRIGSDYKCTLWVNPKNNLQTIFHRKPWTTTHF